MVKNERESALDLLRCIAFLFVVIFHFFLFNAYEFKRQIGFSMWLAGSFRWLSVSCIGLFLMLTGYLKSEKDIISCYKSLLSVIIGYVIASAVSIPIRHFLLGEAHSFTGWILKFAQFSAVHYGWYVEMFIGLTLLCPFVNLIIKNLQTAKSLVLLCVVMLIITALPGSIRWDILPDYWRNIYPLTYYILGAVIKRLQPKIKPWLGILGAFIIACVLGAITVLSTDKDLSNARTWEFPDLWIVMIVCLLFIALYRIKIGPAFQKVLAFAASGCYGGYLLSHLLDAWCYKLIPQWRTASHYPLQFICIAIPIFLISLLAGCVLNKITNSLTHIIMKLLPSKIKKL